MRISHEPGVRAFAISLEHAGPTIGPLAREQSHS
jgi:hypothetical protein